jgi:hypothetical protein
MQNEIQAMSSFILLLGGALFFDPMKSRRLFCKSLLGLGEKEFSKYPFPLIIGYLHFVISFDQPK